MNNSSPNMNPKKFKLAEEDAKKENKIASRPTRSMFRMNSDFAAGFPTELSQLIFSYLPAEDLRRCMQVSKRWWELANTDHLWKSHCIQYGLKPNKVCNTTRSRRYQEMLLSLSQEEKMSGLCSWAKLWRSFRQSPAFAWRTQQWRTETLEGWPHRTRSATDDNTLIISSGASLDLHLPQDFTKKMLTIQFPNPLRDPSEIAISHKLLAVTKHNTTLIYKIFGPSSSYRYKLYMGIAVIENKVERIRKNIRSFMKANLRPQDPCTCIVAMAKGSIWLRQNESNDTFVVNLRNGQVTRCETYSHSHITKSFVVSWSRRKLSVDSISGKNVLKLNLEVNSVRINKKILITFSYNKLTGEMTIDTWELASGKRLGGITLPSKLAFYEIHPTRDILYELEARRECISSICPVTGKVFWTVQGPKVIHNFGWCLRVICEKYLLLIQSIALRGKMFLLDANTGKFLYETERPPGQVEHMSDNMLICKFSDRFFVTSFV